MKQTSLFNIKEYFELNIYLLKEIIVSFEVLIRSKFLNRDMYSIVNMKLTNFSDI